LVTTDKEIFTYHNQNLIHYEYVTVHVHCQFMCTRTAECAQPKSNKNCQLTYRH